ncbi:double-strand break repair helicase AddA [Rhodoplanes serenus]|uniref:DNA 3'-5' helicase n=1 Tax=Rhodoplanes serenus TaxID=200615 RepID=A0A9X4XT16_9BRAD|nr:double-strand break repair helicase AddA [Rhodoplanes serenus]MTW18206.1 double-strand break repair helicase AddA [Rhodoplanes serenus]
MSRVKTVPAAVTAVQTEVADPAVSAFVSANAGSGKTHVLAQRVIRLLLAGVDPAKILCITFTKAAAANMADRVFGQLAGWIALDDEALDAKLCALGVTTITAATRAQARTLFAAALDTPGGLKVETIHAFCTRLLQRFPFEAAVPAHFAVLDERATDELLDRATLAVMLDATAAPDGPLGRALTAALAAAADQTLRDLVRETVFRRHDLTAWIAAAGGLDAAIAGLSATLGVAADESVADIDKAIVEGPLFPPSEWDAVAELCRASSTNDQKQCARLSAAAAATGRDRVESYLDVFLTGDRAPRKSVITAALAKTYPALAERLDRERERIVALLERRCAAACRDRTAALLTLATAVIDRTTAEKNRRGLLDYDDLIDKTLDLLVRTPPGWVHYKLDRAIDHVLVDEAQDTSPKQWEIIRHLVAEFTAGAGARTTRRSIFAVGDEKQSIFSFQGAVPREFARMRQHFAAAHRTGGLDFRAREFKFSFRSGASVLGAVDAVFAAREMYASVTSDTDGVPPHEPLPDAAPGVVELWPLMPAEPTREMEGWEAPFDATLETSPRERLARRIARTIRDMIDRGEPAGPEPRPLTAGDVLVLVRQRGPMFTAIIRALEEAKVPVAGADRLALGEHVAIVDLMALADALLLHADDLALAIALKSPLFGFDDDLLFALAHGRRGSLWGALRRHATTRPEFAEAAARLDRCAAAARRHGPFGFFSWLLGAEGGRRRILARLGREANDALDEFLALALDFERRETPSLQGFVAWLRAAESEIKRDMEITRDEVRVMTVHGAKGLEAPLVFLADTTQPPAGPRPPRLLTLAPDPAAAPGTPGALVWAGRKDSDAPALADARAAAARDAEDEYRRLLYVAMTRAAHRLIVCGCAGKQKPPARCWHELITTHLGGRPEILATEVEGHDAPVLVFRKASTEAPPAVAAPAQSAPEPPEPAWLRTAPAAQAAMATLSPSRAHAASPRAANRGGGGGADAATRAAGRARGRLVHRLLQSLPDVVPARRAEAAAAMLARNAPALDGAARDRLAAETLAIVDDPRFALLFGPDSRAEVPIVGRLVRRDGSLFAVSGQVDRLVVTPEAVLIADFKTDRTPPRRAAEAPAGYVAQLALYAAVLAQVWPDRPVRTVLVWTETAVPMELSERDRSAALAALGLAPGGAAP